MNETIKIWLEKLYENEIEETKGTLDNEILWAMAQGDKEQVSIHFENIALLKEYIEVLKELKNNI